MLVTNVYYRLRHRTEGYSLELRNDTVNIPKSTWFFKLKERIAWEMQPVLRGSILICQYQTLLRSTYLKEEFRNCLLSPSRFDLLPAQFCSIRFEAFLVPVVAR